MRLSLRATGANGGKGRGPAGQFKLADRPLYAHRSIVSVVQSLEEPLLDDEPSAPEKLGDGKGEEANVWPLESLDPVAIPQTTASS